MLAIAATLAGLTVFTLVLAAIRPNRTPEITRRLAHLQREAAQDPYEASFAERVIAPIVKRVAHISTGILPTRIHNGIDERLERAGRPMATAQFITLWVAWTLALPVIILLLIFVLTGSIGGQVLPGLVVWAALGIGAPWFWLRSAGNRRSRAIDRRLPDAIDLIVTNVEAGLGLQAAMLSVAEKFTGPIAEEFGRVVREVSVGRSRDEALLDMAYRSGAPDMRLFAHAIAQAERTGISIGRVLRSYAKESRERRHQRAREQAGRIPVKITIPTALFIFPTLFIIVLGPVGLRALETFNER